MSHHLVETIDLCFSYPDSPPALNGVSLRITHGESVAVVGGNGAGKSTLLLHLNGLLTPSSGQVRVGDIPVTQNRRPRPGKRGNGLPAGGRPAIHAYCP